jgi:hypothetical protein
MAIEDKWILFLERNPQFYELSRGDFFIRFLEKISEGAKGFHELTVLFPKIEEKDLYVIMDSFLKLGVVSSNRVGLKIFFTLTVQGKKLLSAHKATHKFFST